MLASPILWSLCWLAVPVRAVTVYNQKPFGATASATSTVSGAVANYTGAAAYNPIQLNPPPIPSPAPATQFPIQLQTTAAEVVGISIAQAGTFLGFSIEFSVINQVLGINGSFLQVPFLNLMANLKERAGAIHIRVGGNTQETASLVSSLPAGKMIAKDKQNSTNPTDTPALLYTPEVFYMMANISALVNTKWYLGIPMNDTQNLRLQIAESSEAILGDNVLGMQVGNEPDLYAAHQHRPQDYSPNDYFTEFGTVINAVGADTNIPVKNNLIGPSVSGTWSPEDVWDTGFIPAYNDSLLALAVEHYPNDNCFAQFGVGNPVDAQALFPEYLQHTSGQNIVKPYLNSTAIAQAAGKPFLMFETNTGSCGGFAGISDVYGAALWGIDYGMQMAYSNFSGGLMHVGGQSVFYNPFTPPPTNQSTFHQWTIGPIYYSALVMAEAFGPSGNAQIIDLNANNFNPYTPAYAIYENGAPSRVALFNYVDDSSGQSALTVSISIGGGQTGQPNGVPAQVKVKYLSAASVSQKVNITWAGQTFGANFDSDGRLQGDLDIQTINCDQNANTCQIPVPAPGFALVFLSDQAFGEESTSATLTFPTTALTKTANTATIDSSLLATSNGHSGSSWRLSSTSKGSANGASALRAMIPNIVVLLAMGLGATVVGRAIGR